MADPDFEDAEKALEDANFFLGYRNPTAPLYTFETLLEFWRLQNYVEPAPVGRPAQFPGWPAAQGQDPIPALEDYQQQFLNKTIPELADIPTAALSVNWVGTKFLAEGGASLVGMWQYNGPPTNDSMPRKVVVKELRADKTLYNLQQEINHTNALSKNYSDHIVALVQKLPKATTGAAEGFGPEWDGIVRRMILEYSSFGDLDNLLGIRRRM
jgi:hypothetical protein